jgi:hypothetical protein
MLYATCSILKFCNNSSLNYGGCIGIQNGQQPQDSCEVRPGTCDLKFDEYHDEIIISKELCAYQKRSRIVPYAYHTRTIRVPYAYHTRTIRVPYA